MKPKDFFIRIAKHGYRKISGKTFPLPESDLNRQSANNKIFDILTRPAPCMISRLGTTEMICVNNYLCVHSERSYSKRIWDYITDSTQTPWWYEDFFKKMVHFSGIFPPSIETSEKFSERYLRDIPEIDLLGSFQYHEKFIPLRKDVIKVHLETLYPFFVSDPWTRALKGKKVLVVHPFDMTIHNQYKQRTLLFDNKDILPDFELITFRAVQSIVGTKTPFKDWFEALKYMEDKISHIDFDLCILGAGGYGLPLAAHVKRMGKKAIHMGGGTQLLFGIKGNRWNSNYKWSNLPESFDTDYSKLYNEFWVRASENETPKNAEKMENGCYW